VSLACLLVILCSFLRTHSHRVTAGIAFTARRFQPSFTCHLLLAFAEIVLIERFGIADIFPQMLSQSNKLGRHTDVILMTKNSEDAGLTVVKFSWAHIDHRPWGQHLPLQCPRCGLVDSWMSVHVSGVYYFECTNVRCKKLMKFTQPADSKKLVPGKTGSSCWLAIHLPVVYL
jgi:phage FluMu protein Com